jgi:cellulose synthase/poly-beta-1,6-N-acetylglucosamine synthase-like glycosyltransferase
MMLLEVGEAAAILAVFVLCYPHVLYPLWLVVARRLFYKPINENRNQSPNVHVLMAAYNEEACIAANLAALMQTNYPADRMRITVGDDGSSDRTAEIVANLAHEDHRISLISFPRSGKNAVLDALISVADGEIVVFMDADIVCPPEALNELLAPFADPTVGAVISHNDRSSKAFDTNSGSAGESRYRRLENVINQSESDIHFTVASNGALYAVRREHVRVIKDRRVADDFAMVLRVMADGKRVIFQPSAKVTEVRVNSIGLETTRTARTAASGLSALWMERGLLLPWRGWVAAFLWSHRVLRYLSPFALILLFVSTWFTLADPMIFGCLFYGQLLMYGLAFVGWSGSKYGQVVPVASVAEYFVAMNISLALGWWRFMVARSNDTWTPGRA